MIDYTFSLVFFSYLLVFFFVDSLFTLRPCLVTVFVDDAQQYLDFDNLPDTNFTCAGKVIGGYYADLETSCQMFHVCVIGMLCPLFLPVTSFV